MSILVTTTNLESTFLAAWTTTPVHIDNVEGKPDGNPYILMLTAQNFSEQPCLGRDPGATWERDEGDCILMVHVPVNYEGNGLALAESARIILSQRRIAETITDVGYTVAAGVAPTDARYYIYNVRIPYRTDNIKTEA